MFYFISKCIFTVSKIFFALGNDRPQIIVQLEDYVLKAIIALSEGKSREMVLDNLHAQFSSLKKELDNDEVALSWFDLEKIPCDVLSTPPPSYFASSPATAYEFFNPMPSVHGAVSNIFKDRFQGSFSLYFY